MKRQYNFKVGDKVFAKVKGYPPWPARITAENGKKFNVEFYGTGETGTIKAEDIYYYLKNKEKFRKPLKRKDYIDAFEQIDAAIEKDGGDGDDAPLLNDSLPNDSIISTGSNIPTTPAEKKVVKRKRPLEETLAVTPKKKSNRSSKTAEEPAKPTEPNESVEASPKIEESAREANLKKSPKQSPKPAKTPAKVVKKNSEDAEVTEAKTEKKPDDKPKTAEEIKEKEVIKNDQKESKTIELKSDDKKEGEIDLERDLVSENNLKHIIVYAKHLQTHPPSKEVEPRKDFENQIIVAKTPSGSLIGIKLHKNWPLKFDNERNRAAYDEEVAVRVLETKQKIESGDITETRPPDFVPIDSSEEQIKEIFRKKALNNQKQKIARLNVEAELLGLDVKIKNCLGLDKADPKQALNYLEEMSNLEFDELILKKHLHIVEMIRRLRKYVGNTREWKMNDETLNEFMKQAEKVREMAEKVYAKFKKVVKLSKNYSSFFEGFTDLVNKFRAECQKLDLSESEVFELCAEPMSRQAFLNRLNDKDSEKEDEKVDDKLVNGTAEITAT